MMMIMMAAQSAEPLSRPSTASTGPKKRGKLSGVFRRNGVPTNFSTVQLARELNNMLGDVIHKPITHSDALCLAPKAHWLYGFTPALD